jgi:GNAT superfamily N-acetyltransferase
VAIRIRRARPDEHARVGALTLAAYDAVGRITGPYREDLRDPSARAAQGQVVLVAVADDDRVLGTVTVVDDGDLEEVLGAGDASFRVLAVDPQAQGRGVGRALVAACVERLRGLGRRRIAIYSMEWMPAAHALYGSAGFVRRPDLDVTFPAGVGVAFQLDLVEDAAAHFPPPGAVPDVPPWYLDARAARRAARCA